MSDELVIAVPARDECERIVACLSACALSVELSGLRARFLVLVNGSTDDTARCVRMWATHRQLPTTIVQVDFAPGLSHAGAARRLALELAGRGVAPGTTLLTTDADARPQIGWVTANLRHLHAGADLVCGAIRPMPSEAAQLPRRLERFGELEARYRAGVHELEHWLDPDPRNPWPHHGGASGASLAMRAGVLEAVGGVPLVPSGEDRALASRMRENDRIVVHADDVRVEVSCRAHGRAAGGMADTIRYRMADPDPWCDEAIRSARAVHARLLDRASLRALWAMALPGERIAALERRGVDATYARSLAREDIFAAAWGHYERAVLDAAFSRLRFSALPGELVQLEALLVRARAGAVNPIRPQGPIGAPVAAERTS